MVTNIKQPLVSVIVPVYNGERYLALALKSIFEQDYTPFEVIVIDDGSTDSGAEIARSYQQVRYFHQPNQGVAVARNHGIQLSEGEFIAFLDQDDIWLPKKLTLQISHLRQHPEVDYSITHGRIFLEPGTGCPRWLRTDYLSKDFPAFFPSALVARKSVFEKVGHFDPGYQMGSDTDWFFRANRQGTTGAVLPETLFQRRIHEANHSYQTKVSVLEMLKIAKASVDHKRTTRSKG